jgi:hypothetical protein
MPKGGRPERPAWLPGKKSSHDQDYEIDPNRAAAVLWMFRASENGLSDEQIAASMPPRYKCWSPEWAPRSIAKILTDSRSKGAELSLPSGDFVKIPGVVDDALFASVQEARGARQHGVGQRADGDFCLHLRVAKCECCEQEMKDRTMRGRRFLVCLNKACPAYGQRLPYHNFEISFDNELSRSTGLRWLKA